MCVCVCDCRALGLRKDQGNESASFCTNATNAPGSNHTDHGNTHHQVDPETWGETPHEFYFFLLLACVLVGVAIFSSVLIKRVPAVAHIDGNVNKPHELNELNHKLLDNEDDDGGGASPIFTPHPPPPHTHIHTLAHTRSITHSSTLRLCVHVCISTCAVCWRAF